MPSLIFNQITLLNRLGVFKKRDPRNTARTLIAREEGILPGGGVANLRTITVLETAHLPGEEQLVVAPVKRALEEPLRQIAINAGFEDSVVLQHVIEGLGSFSFNAEIGTFEDLITAGIVDPTKVSRLALQNAASVAGLLIAAEAMIAEKPGKNHLGMLNAVR